MIVRIDIFVSVGSFEDGMKEAFERNGVNAEV